MANIKELRGRIKSVQGISKITRAMEMVASMKLRKVQARALAFRPYTAEIRGLIAHLAEFVGDSAERPLFRRREKVETIGVFLVTSDRGLCGAYNSNITAEVHRLERQLKAQGRALKFYVYGKKGYSYLHRRRYDIERFFAEPPLDQAGFPAARMVGESLVEAFETGIVDEVKVAYTDFESAGRFKPAVIDFLPLVEAPTGESEQQHRTDYLLEPDPTTIFDRLIPRYLQTVIYDAMLESLASEHASRRIAMKAATDAAEDMGKTLKKIYNRARQESITKELLDIIGGAEAVG